MERPPSPTASEEAEAVSQESEARPEKLYRAFVVSPESLSTDLFEEPLVMGLAHESDESKSLDGNEAGVYMSTNETMVESTNYAHRSTDAIAVPRYMTKNGLTDSIPLRGCGVIVEVATEGLAIREPQISEAMQGHYNNGFEGTEWIADEVPADKYRVAKLTFSLGANDTAKMAISVDRDDPGALAAAIAEIQERAREERAEAERFGSFLETLTQEERYNENIVSRRWRDFQEGAEEDTEEDGDRSSALVRLRKELTAAAVPAESQVSVAEQGELAIDAHLKDIQAKITAFFEEHVGELLGQLGPADLKALQTVLSRELNHGVHGDLAQITLTTLSEHESLLTGAEGHTPDEILAMWRAFSRDYAEKFNASIPPERVLALDDAPTEDRTARLLELLAGMRSKNIRGFPQYLRRMLSRASDTLR